MTTLSVALAKNGTVRPIADLPPILSFRLPAAGTSPVSALQHRVRDAALRGLFAAPARRSVTVMPMWRVCAALGSALAGWGLVFATVSTLAG